jgi:hypothetical protein
VSQARPRGSSDPGPAPGARVSGTRQEPDRRRLGRLAVRVLIVQVLALAGLWLLQSHFGAS